MKWVVVVSLFVAQFAMGDAIDKKRNFNIVAYRLGYSEKLHAMIMETCERAKIGSAESAACKKKAGPVFQVLRKKMEASFYETFPGKSEQEYFGTLFSHPLMGKLYDFRTEFIEDPATRQQILDELKK